MPIFGHKLKVVCGHTVSRIKGNPEITQLPTNFDILASILWANSGQIWTFHVYCKIKFAEEHSFVWDCRRFSFYVGTSTIYFVNLVVDRTCLYRLVRNMVGLLEYCIIVICHMVWRLLPLTLTITLTLLYGLNQGQR